MSNVFCTSVLFISHLKPSASTRKFSLNQKCNHSKARLNLKTQRQIRKNECVPNYQGSDWSCLTEVECGTPTANKKKTIKQGNTSQSALFLSAYGYFTICCIRILYSFYILSCPYFERLQQMPSSTDKNILYSPRIIIMTNACWSLESPFSFSLQMRRINKTTHILPSSQY